MDRTSTLVVSPEKQCIEFTSFFFFPFGDMRGQVLYCFRRLRQFVGLCGAFFDGSTVTVF